MRFLPSDCWVAWKFAFTLSILFMRFALLNSSSSADKRIFQFSLWDSQRPENEGRMEKSIHFQFSLWDSWGPDVFAHLKEWFTFNSLYEILRNTGKFFPVMAAYQLSILFMRFEKGGRGRYAWKYMLSILFMRFPIFRVAFQNTEV